MTYVEFKLIEGFQTKLKEDMFKHYRDKFRMNIPTEVGCHYHYNIHIYDFDGETIIIDAGDCINHLKLITPETDKKKIENKLEKISRKTNCKFEITNIK